MKQKYSFAAFLLLLLLFLPFRMGGIRLLEQQKVYVVMSNNAYAYHKTKDCSAVKKATHKVKEVSLEEAEKMGRKPCKICYK